MTHRFFFFDGIILMLSATGSGIFRISLDVLLRTATDIDSNFERKYSKIACSSFRLPLKRSIISTMGFRYWI